MSKRIQLTRGKFATVDDEDYGFISQWEWFCDSGGYAVRSVESPKENGNRKRSVIRMHRIIAKTPDGMRVDHRDHDRLNNQRYNLRNATEGQNSMNRKPYVGKKSPYKGVTQRKGGEKWIAQIRLNKKLKHIGSYTKETEAAAAYNREAKKLFGEFALLNEI
jgi:hypothetical protein